MSHIKNILYELLAHYTAVRQVGYTTDAVKLCAERDYTLVTATAEQSKQFKRDNIRTVSLHEIASYSMRGKTEKVVLDNYAITSLLTESLSEIKKLEEKNTQLSTEKSVLANRVIELQLEANKLNSYIPQLITEEE